MVRIVNFSEEIERKYLVDRSESYLQTILLYCEENSLDYQDVIKHISPSLKQKIEIEGVERGWLRPTSKPAFTF